MPSRLSRTRARAARSRLVALLALAIVGCKGPPHPPAAAAPGEARRIVSLAPSTTEVLFALGAGDRVVGVDQFSDWPPAARALPRVGSDLEPSVERILGLQPDLVFAAASANTRELVAQLEHLHVHVIITEADTLADVWRDIERVGDAIGHGAQARALIAAERARLAAVAHAVAGQPRPRALVVVWPEPLTVAGGHTFVDEAITAAGGEDLAADSPVPYPSYSVERLLVRAPDVIVVGTHANQVSLAPFERLTTLPAVRNHRLYTIDGDLLFRPGPRLVDGIEQLAKLLHP